MFADDLILISDSAVGLQNCLSKLDAYCKKWRLTVNTEKTKILIFNKGGKKIKKYKFFINGNDLDIVQSYCYLGITFSASGTFKLAIENLHDKAKKALFKLKQHNLRDNVQVGIKLFNALISPILRYGSEVWAPFQFKKLNENNFYDLCEKVPIEKINNSFCKYLLGVNKFTSNHAVKGELGSWGLSIDCLYQAVKYWFRICECDKNSLLYKSYLENYKNLRAKESTENWCTYVKQILAQFDLSPVWENQGAKNKNKILKLLKQKMYSCYEKDWKNHCVNSSKLKTYSSFKSNFCLENYVITQPLNDRKQFTKLRVSAHNLHIESGRYVKPKTPAILRKCPFCPNALEDELHFILNCCEYQTERKNFFSRIQFIDLKNLTDNEKFNMLMSCDNGDTELIKEISEFTNQCFEIRMGHLPDNYKSDIVNLIMFLAVLVDLVCFWFCLL